MSFVSDYISGYAFEDDIHKHIDIWHEDDSIKEELHDYLGFTWNEYVEWVKNPSYLSSVLLFRTITDDE